MDRFDAMRAFVRVVETGSFTKAASTLHMSKTTVTQLVQQLETHLRIKLLNRTTRKVNLTADGVIYYERVTRLLSDMDDLEAGLSRASVLPRGRLRVDVPSPFARLFLIPALPDFHARYPDIQLDLGASDRMVDLIDEKIDCVIRGGALTDLSLVARHAGDLPIGIYASPGYLERCGSIQHPKELENSHHRIVGFRGARVGKVLPYDFLRDKEHVSVQGQYILSVDDGNAYLAAGLAGLGMLWLPHYMAAAHFASGELVPLLEEWKISPMPLYIAFPANRNINARLRVFVDWVAELIALHLPVNVTDRQ